MEDIKSLLDELKNRAKNFRSFFQLVNNKNKDNVILNFFNSYYTEAKNQEIHLYARWYYNGESSNIRVPKCPICNKDCKNHKNDKFLSTCGSRECSNIIRKQTCLEKYGEITNLLTEETKEQIKQTNLEKYGVEYTFQSELVKDKIKKTNLERYGVDNPAKSKLIIEKTKISNLKKYGVEHPNQDKELYNKIIQTNLERYGIKSTLELKEVQDKIKQTNLERYGKERYTETEKYKIETKYLNSIKKTNRYNDIIEKYDLPLILDGGVCYCKICNNKFSMLETFIKSRFLHFPNTVCPFCYPKKRALISNSEIRLRKFIKELLPNEEIIENSRILDGKEIDIYIPSMNIGFEYNGVYWHSELFKDKYYHRDKSKLASEKGIKLIHIWEDDWVYKQEIVKSRIRNILNKTENKIYGRNTNIKEISHIICRDFLNMNHIQGNGVGNIRYGLYYKDELVSVIQIDSSGQLSRFANKLNTNVIGGFSKLFKYCEQYIKYTFIDLDWSGENNIYSKYMKFDSYVKPSWYLILEDRRIHRRNFQKKKLLQMGLGTPEQTEHEITLQNKIFRIYNSGNIKYVRY